MIDLNPEEVHISLYDTAKTGSWDTNNYMKGVTVIHLPTGTEVSVGSNKSVHKNKHQAMIILQDLLTPFKQGDIIVTSLGLGEITCVHEKFNDVSFTFDDCVGSLKPISEVAHTEEGYRYKNILRLKEKLSIKEQSYYNERDIILEEIKQLEGGV